MKRSGVGNLVFVSTLLLVFAACSGEKVVIDEMQSLKDGQFVAYKLTPGRYLLQMTASNDGASAEWIGATCPPTEQTKDYETVCELRKDGQLIVKNPTVFGSGATSTVTIKVTRL
jgi:hypothetical protein